MKPVPNSPGCKVVPYSGQWLERMAARREDATWLAEVRAAPDVQVIPLWRDQCVVDGAPGRAIRLTGPDAGELLARSAEAVFLGLDGCAGIFAVDLSDLDEERAVSLVGGTAVVDARTVFTAHSAGEAATLAYARGLLHWVRNQRYCGRCGAATELRSGGHVRACIGSDCGRLLFPRIEPAVIMLVQSATDPGRCLLARHRNSVLGRYSTLAGFVEVGESLEDAVRREVAEEVGLTVGSVFYVGSQPWPFPSGLMVAFRAVVEADTVDLDHNELVDAKWFTRAELAAEAAADRLGRVDSIDRVLLTSWIEETG